MQMREVFNLRKVKRLRAAKAGYGIAAVFFVLVLAALVKVSMADDPVYYASATYGWDRANITVTINQKTIVDVTPEVMNFGLTDPGTIVTAYNVSDGTNNIIQLSKFEIENLGSTNLTHVWLNVTQPNSNPFGTGLSGLYDPGNWIAVNVSWYKDGITPTYTNTISFIDRIEFNESKELVYLNLPPNTKSYGRLRVANREYFWAINSSGANCDSSTSTPVYLILSNPNEPHNVTQTGDINLVDGDEVIVGYQNVVGTDPNSGITYSLPTTSITYNGEEYVFLVATDCSHIRVVKWNADAPGSTLLSNGGYLFEAATPDTGIYPGQAIALNIEMRVPYGVVAGKYEGWLTVVADSI